MLRYKVSIRLLCLLVELAYLTTATSQSIGQIKTKSNFLTTSVNSRSAKAKTYAESEQRLYDSDFSKQIHKDMVSSYYSKQKS